ncbi:5-deoxy-glucuronate isomerase [Microbacterium terrae]|uniref:5-deoxy-glucuronate isomerase n=1 Tax=Microbacterium terrae TaxID=69369 RepID=A0A0M2HFU6_9MICO|nr:5-deoxy-glucuronate isomerase [Microbacterium terrae]KJL45552.1 5-deoxy-glucuronate isomerase [Microbacterium terrae]MBP1079387.1 5-deoxy-glucuronate isomerase [Microbacterium terrae]GLJ98787.1 5-deoxy-glucuronate isomerase [Microbacterium terrae]
MTDPRWFHRRGALARGEWESVVDETTPGWQHTGIRIAEVTDAVELTLPETGVERIVVPLAGSFTVTHTEDGATTETGLVGRPSVFAGPTDVLYLSAAATAVVRGAGRVAVATSPTDVVKKTTYIPAAGTPVELRGGGSASRQVHNFGTPAALDAARLIVCEVITPASNWSSYPPHKHDEHIDGHESRLEEIYYFESAPGAGSTGGAADDAFGIFSAYSSPSGEIEIDARVRSGDIALIPHGYHGPAVAAPGYDLYYLNVMAGPDPERQWLISDDPAHAWVRDSWPVEGIDPRLPLGHDSGSEQ